MAPVAKLQGGKAKVGLPTRGSGVGLADPQDEADKAYCPLCVELMDETDLAFKPCPCGYKICLFCVDRVKLECQGLCPNCRRAYGEEGEVDDSAAPNDGDAEDSGLSTSTHAGPSTSSSASGPQRSASGPQAQAAQQRKATNGYVLAKPSAGGVLQQQPLPGTAVARGPEAARRSPFGQYEEQVAGLPSGVTWASGGREGGQENGHASRAGSLPPASVDETAWPSLSDTMATARQQQQQQRYEDSVHMQRSSSATVAGGDRHRTHPNEPGEYGDGGYDHHVGNGGLGTAQVTTTVNGMRRVMVVPMGGAGAAAAAAAAGGGQRVAALPDAQNMLNTMQAAVKNRALTGHEAAQHLVAMLRQQEDKATRQAAATLQPPPGFGAPVAAAAPSAAPPARSPPSFAPSLNNDANPIVAPPPRQRYNPISPPGPVGRPVGGGAVSAAPGKAAAAVGGGRRLDGGAAPSPSPGQAGQQPQQAHLNAVAGGRAEQGSLWISHGLPGVDLAAHLWGGLLNGGIGGGGAAGGYGMQLNGGGGGGYAVAQASALDPHSHQHAAAAAAGGYQPLLAAKAPPPGFGNPPPGYGVPVDNGAAARNGVPPGYRPPPQPIGSSRYNPLDPTGRGGAAGGGLAPAGYRPQMG